jgi:hypothetical protein
MHALASVKILFLLKFFHVQAEAAGFGLSLLGKRLIRLIFLSIANHILLQSRGSSAD